MSLVACAPPSAAPTHASPLPVRAPSHGYPTSYPRLAAAEVDATKADLSRDFAQLAVDDYGFADAVRSKPLASAVTSVDLASGARWIDRVKSSPAFGLDPSTSFERGASFVFADQELGGQRVARVAIGPYGDAVQISGHHWPSAVTPPPATVDAARIEARLVGATYDAEETFGPPPCVHDVPCVAPPPVRSVVTVTREMIRSSEAIRVVKRADGSALEVRRVARVALAPTPMGGTVRYTPRGDAPTIPWIIDTVTAEDLSKTQWCRGIMCSDWTMCATDCGPL